MNLVRFERLTSNAKIPTKSSENAAGFDLFAAYSGTVPKFNSCLIMTDLSIKMPRGVYGRLSARPGISVMYNVFIGAEVIGKEKIRLLNVFE